MGEWLRNLRIVDFACCRHSYTGTQFRGVKGIIFVQSGLHGEEHLLPDLAGASAAPFSGQGSLGHFDS